MVAALQLTADLLCLTTQTAYYERYYRPKNQQVLLIGGCFFDARFTGIVCNY